MTDKHHLTHRWAKRIQQVGKVWLPNSWPWTSCLPKSILLLLQWPLWLLLLFFLNVMVYLKTLIVDIKILSGLALCNVNLDYGNTRSERKISSALVNLLDLMTYITLKKWEKWPEFRHALAGWFEDLILGLHDLMWRRMRWVFIFKIQHCSEVYASVNLTVSNIHLVIVVYDGKFWFKNFSYSEFSFMLKQK